MQSADASAFPLFPLVCDVCLCALLVQFGVSCAVVVGLECVFARASMVRLTRRRDTMKLLLLFPPISPPRTWTSSDTDLSLTHAHSGDVGG